MEASSQNPIETTGSRCALQSARGRHVFEIAGYKLQKDLVDAGKAITSSTVAVGGQDWCIQYYLYGDEREESREYVNQFTMQSKDLTFSKPTLFSVMHPSWGYPKFMRRCDLERPPFLRDDRVLLECDVTVIMGTPVSESRTMFGIDVPPSDLVDDLGKLLESEEEADVSFKVKDQVFHAHKIVLAMRSPVLKAELYGPLGNKSQGCITVKDMQPAVFKALLHFVYTNSLPAMDSLDEHEYEEMVKHLLAAADRYAMERMKLISQDILCKRLHAKHVADTLALADQHHCSKLKDACVQFINSLSRMDDVVASKGYAHLKRACPTVFVDLWEQSAKSRKL